MSGRLLVKKAMESVIYCDNQVELRSLIGDARNFSKNRCDDYIDDAAVFDLDNHHDGNLPEPLSYKYTYRCSFRSTQ